MLDVLHSLGIDNKDLIIYIAIAILVGVQFKSWASLKLKFGSFSIEGIKTNQNNLQSEVDTLRREKEELKDEVEEIKLELKGKILVDPKEYLADKIKLTYHTTLLRQMKCMREQAKLCRLEQLDAFVQAFDLDTAGKEEDTKYYSQMIDTVIQSITKEVYHIFEENHLAEKAWDDNRQVDFSKWESYKTSKIILLWNEQGMETIRRYFSNATTNIPREEINSKVKGKFYEFFKYYMNIVFDTALKLSIEKVHDVEDFKKRHHIEHLDMNEDVVLGFK